jgi:L-fucose mutarotase
MLKTACTHSEILKTLAECGHGDRILIADGNYPLDSNTGSDTHLIYLNLTHGIPLVTDVLKVLEKLTAIEKAEVMSPDTSEEPAIFAEFGKILEAGIEIKKLGRFEFYDECKKSNIKLAIATGEQRTYANILLTVGVVQKY